MKPATRFTRACAAAALLFASITPAYAENCQFDASQSSRSVSFAFHATLGSGTSPLPNPSPFPYSTLTGRDPGADCTFIGLVLLPDRGAPWELVLTDGAGSQWGLDLEPFASTGYESWELGNEFLRVDHYTVITTPPRVPTRYYTEVYDLTGTATFRQISAVPELSTWALFAVGLIGVGVASRRRERR